MIDFHPEIEESVGDDMASLGRSKQGQGSVPYGKSSAKRESTVPEYLVQEKKEEDFGSKIESAKSSHPPNHEEKLSVRSDDRTVIEARIKLLPPGIRKVMEEKFRADFVSIEEINSDLLI